MNFKKLSMALAALAFSCGAITACHTVAGAGQDVSETGQTITHAATATANSM